MVKRWEIALHGTGKQQGNKQENSNFFKVSDSTGSVIGNFYFVAVERLLPVF
jgi:hypothetical protein